MNLERQVVSLELAKRLKELGIKQESLFYWRNYIVSGWQPEYKDIIPVSQGEIISAFTIGELGEMLPYIIAHDHRLEFIKGIYQWVLAYVKSDDLPPLVTIISKKETNARAELLIWLIENGYMKV